MNRAETYFQYLTSLSSVSPVGTTHEGVVPVHMARLMPQARELVLTWCHVGPSRTGATQSRRLL
jgi:hypothetical protein